MPALVVSTSQTVIDGPITVTVPSGTAGEDFLVAVFVSDQDGAFASMTPATGWAEISSSVSVSTAAGYGKIFTRTATNAEGASYIFGGSVGSANSVQVLRITGHDPTNPFSATPVWSRPGAASTTSLVAPTVTLTRTGLLVCGFGMQVAAGTESIAAPSGMAGISQHGYELGGTAYQAGVGVGASGTKTATASNAGDTGVRGYLTVSFAIADLTAYPVRPLFFGASPQLRGPRFVPVPARVPAVPGPPEVPVVGTSVVGGTARVAVGKTAVVTAVAGLGGAVVGAVRKISPQAGRAAAGVAGSGTAVKVAPGGGRSSVGGTALGTGKKTMTTVARSALGVAVASSARKVGVAVGAAAVGGTARGVGQKTSAVVGRAVVGLSGAVAQTQNAVAVVARAFAGIGAVGTAKKAATAAGRSSVAGTTRVGARKTSTVAGVAAVGGIARVLGKRIVGVTARSLVGLVGAAGVRRRAGVVGRAVLGLRAAWEPRAKVWGTLNSVTRKPPALRGKGRPPNSVDQATPATGETLNSVTSNPAQATLASRPGASITNPERTTP
jgi:hypothetical protein